MGWLAYVLFALGAAVVGQALLLRLKVLDNTVHAFVASGTAAGLLLMAVVFGSYPGTVAVSATLLFAFLCELYIFAFTFAYSSISANLLVRLGNSPMDKAEIDGLYDDRAMISERIDGLCRTGLAFTDQGGVLQVTAKGARLAAVFNKLRAFFGHQ